MFRSPIRVAVLTLAWLLVLTAGASGKREVVHLDNLFLADNGGISPSKLPRQDPAPITARLFGEIGTLDGSHPPALQTLQLEVDRTIGIDAVGLPTCSARRIEARTSGAARRACRGAIIGSGSAEVEVAFAEQNPFTATGPVVLFNGGVRGRKTFVLLHAYVAVPTPTAIVIRATVTRIHRGRFGLLISARIPSIAGGAASTTRFRLKIGRRFTYEGRRKSLLVASCPSGRWQTRGKLHFSDRTVLGLTHTFPCKPRPIR